MSAETAKQAQRPTPTRRMSNETFITLFMIAVLVVLFVIAGTVVPNFFQPQSLINLLTNNWFIIIIGIGVTFLLITGNFDMSVGGVIGLSGVLSVYFVQGVNVSPNELANGLGMPYLVAIIAAVVTPTTDALTMSIFMAPMIVLYLLGIGVSALVARRKRRAEAVARAGAP